MKKRNNILPDDVMLNHILPRLPARSIGRFMCVCKQWHSFLTTPMFTKMHLHHVNNENHHKLVVVSTTKPHKFFQTIDCEAPKVGLSSVKKHSVPFEVSSNYEMSIISSLNGLLCVGIKPTQSSFGYNYSEIYLWNPLTSEYKTLSKGDYFTIPPRGHGLYYSCCDDDYKLLCITQSSDAYIYSWKSDSWRKAKSSVDSLVKNWHTSCLLHEKLYFLAQEHNHNGTRPCSIIRFDIETETFAEIPTPFLENVTHCFDMMVVRGCIHLCVSSARDCFVLEMWKMERDGEWTKVVLSCKPQCGHISWHMMKNGNWLMYSHHKVYVYEVDPKICYKAEKVFRYATNGTMKMRILRRAKFVETIVSLNR